MPGKGAVCFVLGRRNICQYALELLSRCEGWQPETFASAQEFLSRPRTFAPSCLILDVGLPDLNGLDLQNRIAGDRMVMPIIFITGHGDVPMTVRAMKAGALEFLIKPFAGSAALATRGLLFSSLFFPLQKTTAPSNIRACLMECAQVAHMCHPWSQARTYPLLA